MAIAADVIIDYTNKTLNITANIYTVKEFYTYLMDVFDELVQMDDDVPIKYNTPTEYELINSWTFLNDATVEHLKGGSVKVNKIGGDDLWANLYSLGALESGTIVFIIQNGVRLPIYWAAGHIDILVKVMADGSLIDSGNLTVFARQYGKLYDHFGIDVSAGGRNAVPLATFADTNNATAEGTVAGYSDITLTFGTAAKDLNNGNGAVNYDVVINCAGRSLAQVYEYLKYITRRASTDTLNGLDGYRYISVNPAYAPVKASPFGTFAGGKFFGPRGVWLENYDAADANSFQLIDAAGVTQAPPNTVPVKVTGVVSGDVVAVFRLITAGGDIKKAEYAAAAGNNLGNGTVVVGAAISSDTPSSGTVIIDGEPYAYTSWAGSAFTLSGTLAKNYTGGVDVYVPLLFGAASGTAAQTIITYSASIPVVIRVRCGGVILPFEVESEVTATGLSVAAIRNLDGVAA